MKAQTRRTLKDGTAYDGLIVAASAHHDRVIQKQAGVPETLKLVARVTVGYRGEVAKLADKLAVRVGGRLSLDATCRAIWNFVYDHIQYELDEEGLEQVRHPSRSWADRVRGVDCEDYAVFISAMLLNLNVPHLLRISAYQKAWQHIYVIVPKLGTDLPKGGVYEENYAKAQPDEPRLRRANYITLDCVTDQYNYEVTPSKTMNYPMPILMELSGLPGVDDYESAPVPGVPVPERLVITYPSATGHTIGVGELGGFYVREDEGMGELGELGAIGRFKPLEEAQRRLGARGQRISRKAKKGGLIKKLTGQGGYFRNPADVPGATAIAATWVTESNHLAGINHLGELFVMDENDRLGELAGLAGYDLNDPALAGWLKNAFRKVGTTVSSVGKGIAKGATAAYNGVATGVQKGIFDPLNKIPGVKYVADNYGKDILQVAAGAALSAATGGAAAPALLALKAAKGVSLAAKVAKVASVAKKAQTVVSAAQKASKVAKVVSVAKKAAQVVKVAKNVSALVPRNAKVGAAQTLTDNPQPLSFMPADPNMVQDHTGGRVPNLVQPVQVAAPAPAPAPAGPTLPLSPETSYAAATESVAVRPTASVTAPQDGEEAGTYAQEVTAYDEASSDEPAATPAVYAAPDEEIGGLGGLNISSTTVLVGGACLVAAGLLAAALGSSGSSSSRSSGLSGTPKRRRKAPTASAGGKRKSAGRKGVSKRGNVQVIRL